MSDPIKTIYAPEHARMLKALSDDKAVVVYHRSGPTWNDGGAWHRIVARLSDGSHVSVKMESDYAPDRLIVEPVKQWPPMDDKAARIADLERQLAEARDKALEDAALACDDLSGHSAGWDRNTGYSAKFCADAIRNLKGTP